MHETTAPNYDNNFVMFYKMVKMLMFKISIS